MNDTNNTHVLGKCRCRNAERIARAMAGLILAELPTMVLERWNEPVTDLVTHAAQTLCRTYALELDHYAAPIINYVFEHIASYLPGLEPSAAPIPPSLPPECNRRNAWITSRLDHLHPSAARSALLQHISGGYELIAAASRDEVEQQITRHERLFATIYGGVHRALRHFGGIDDSGHRADPKAWQAAELDDLMKAIMTSVRANLGPVFSDVIVKETTALAKRHRS